MKRLKGAENRDKEPEREQSCRDFFFLSAANFSPTEIRPVKAAVTAAAISLTWPVQSYIHICSCPQEGTYRTAVLPESYESLL